MIRVWLWSTLKSWLSIANQSVLDLINERFSFTHYRATYASLALLFSQNFIYIMIDVPRTTKYQLIFHYNYISYLPVTAMVKFVPTLDSGKYLSALRNFSSTISLRLTWDQALFSFRFENYIPVAVRENVWEPLKLGLISGYIAIISVAHCYSRCCCCCCFSLSGLLTFLSNLITFVTTFLLNKNTAKFAQEALGPYRLSKRQNRPELLM